jgi:MarR family transcriptional regulator, organic hydroperoxide resistance regulator
VKREGGKGSGGADVEVGDLGEVLDFIRLLWAVDHGLQSLSKRMKNEMGVTGPQRFTLRLIGRKPGVSAGTLASILHLDPSTLTGVLHRLEERGSIKRSQDPADRRRALFSLTPRGRALDVVKTRTVESAVRRALASVSPAQLESSRAVLAALVRELGAGD